MVVAWHDAAFTLPEPILSPEVMKKILHKFHLQHKLKKNWTKEESMVSVFVFYLLVGRPDNVKAIEFE